MTYKFRQLEGRDIVWTDDEGITHLCEAMDAAPGVRWCWTLCDVDGLIPIFETHLMKDDEMITCAACAKFY